MQVLKIVLVASASNFGNQAMLQFPRFAGTCSSCFLTRRLHKSSVSCINVFLHADCINRWSVSFKKTAFPISDYINRWLATFIFKGGRGSSWWVCVRNQPTLTNWNKMCLLWIKRVVYFVHVFHQISCVWTFHFYIHWLTNCNCKGRSWLRAYGPWKIEHVH